MRFGINNQNMTRLDTDIISSGAKNFVKFRINFSPEWNGYTNTAVFTRSDRTDSFYVYNVEHEKEYYVPSEAIAKEGVCFVNVIGTNGESKLATSNSCFFCIESAASGENNAESEVTASLFAQICARIEAAIAQYFSKEIVLSADENAVYWKYRDETEAKVLFTFDSINIKNEIIDSSKIDIDINDSHIIWTKGNGKWEDLIELSKLKGEKGSKGDRGPSGVYVGSGEMPEDCNIQIDPTGDATEISPESIYAIERRLKTAEMALAGQIILEEVNDSTSLIKHNPENVLPYASVDVVGGKTRKCRNLYSGGDLSFTQSTLVTLAKPLEVGTYTISCICTSTDTAYSANLVSFIGGNGVGENLNITFKRGARINLTITLNSPVSQIRFNASTSYSGSAGYDATFKNIMLNEGETSLPYEPYFEGLRNTAVTDFKSVGANLFNIANVHPNYAPNNQSFTLPRGSYYRDFFTFTAGESKVVPLEYIDKLILLDEGEYTFAWEGDSLSVRVCEVDKTTGTVTNLENIKSGGTLTLSKRTYITIRNISNTETTFTNFQIVKGTNALPYEPYRKSTLPIPEAVKALDSYGWGVSDTVYNYVDWENGKFVKRVGRVDMGTLSWEYLEGRFKSQQFDIKRPSTFEARGTGFLCEKYSASTNRDATALDEKSMIRHDDKLLFVKDTAYADAATFKTAMSGVMLYYELAEPVITDISELLSPDNMLEVYEGGTVEVVTDDDYAESVPTKIRYQTKNLLLNN